MNRSCELSAKRDICKNISFCKENEVIAAVDLGIADQGRKILLSKNQL